MTVCSASLIESKESPEQEPMEEQPAQPEQNGSEQAPSENSAGAPPEVGPSWSKRISAWFGRVRI